MGEVWRATDLELRRIVALKRSHEADGGGQIRREGRIGAGLHHPNVVTVFDTVLDDGTKWLVMEYLSARSLSEIIRTDGPLDPETAALVGAQIAAALAAMHERGMVHRDVTPANILVTPDHLAKLTDFGISSWEEVTLTGGGWVAGTPAYMAPEVAAGHEARRPADMFSLGAVLFAAVEGHSPWGERGQTPDVMRGRAATGQVPPLMRAGELAPVLSDLLHPEPVARPSAAAAKRLLETVSGGTVPVVPVAGLPAPVPAGMPGTDGSPWRRRTPYLVGAGVVVIGLVAAAVVANGAGSHVTGSPRPVPAGAGTVLDARTADPCALLDLSSLRGFGNGVVLLDADYGPFNQCGMSVHLTERPDDIGYVELHLEKIPDYEAANYTLGKLGPVQESPEDEDEDCERVIPLPDGNKVRLVGRNQGAREAEPCDLADAVTEATMVRLKQGPIPRRDQPFPAASLANEDACDLLTTSELALAFDAEPVPAADPELGNWTCWWEGETGEVTIEFTRVWKEPLEEDESPLPLAGRTAALETGDEECAVEIPGREYETYTDQRIDWEEQVTVTLGTDTGADPASLCDKVKVLATAVAGRLPAA